jgi:hypothetical protein
MSDPQVPAETGEASPQQRISGSIQIQSIDDVSRVAQMMAKSGFFDDAKSAAQAGVKIMAGMELGIPPVAAVRGVYVLDGNTCLSSGLLAALIKQHPRYDYKVVEATDERAELAFFEGGERQGTASFSMEEARSIDHGSKKLAQKDNWQNYPSDMCFSRALSRGRRRFCPDIGNGIYTPDEMGAVTDRDGHVVEAEVVDESSGKATRSAPSREKTEQDSQKKRSSDDSRSTFKTESETSSQTTPDGNEYDDLPFEPPKDPPAADVNRFHALGTELYDDWDAKRAELVEAITDGRTDSSADLSATELQQLIEGMEKKLSDQAEKMVG